MRRMITIGLPLTLASLALGTPPDTPVITEPDLDNLILNPQDVHMEVGGVFSDADGDVLLCTDWEIRETLTSQLAWEGLCVTGFEAVHAHFGDGTFMGALAGGTQLAYDTLYTLRVRQQDTGGEWSDWAERPFVTGPQTAIFAYEAEDILEAPAPTWVDSLGAPVVLSSGALPPSVRVENALGELLLELRGFDGINNQVTNPAALSDHTPVRIRVSAGSLGTLVLPESDLTFTDDDGLSFATYLPSMSVASGDDNVVWIGSTGSTYQGSVGQSVPDFSSLLRSPAVPWQPRQPGFRVDVVATGFRMPVNLAFVPNPGPNPDDPLFYVTELYGDIKVVLNDGTVGDYVTGLLNYTPNGAFPGAGEQGLTGIAVDPVSGDVVAAYLSDFGGPHYPRVVRFTSNDGGRTAATETIILDMFGESQGQSHQISNVTIGPDGFVYVHMGDGFDAGTAQDLGSYRGKVLRLDLNGNAPNANPFYDAGNGIDSEDYVFAYGLRNPFGGAWRDSDGLHYQVENGPSVDRITQIISGRNYLWNGSNASMQNFAIHNWDPATGPVNCAFIQASDFGGSNFPAEKMDHFFVTESGPTYASGPQSRGKRITEFVFDGNGDLVSGPTMLVEYVGIGRATACGLAAGPDGLYFTDLYKDEQTTGPTDRGANVLRVQFVGAAEFVADVTQGDAPLTVQFTDNSTVPNPISWLWSFGDGATSTAQNPSHTYTADGFYDVTLTVTGSGGVQSTQRSSFIRVGEVRSVAIIGGNPVPSTSDDAVASHLRDLGFDAQVFDDEPSNRPSASELAAAHNLVIVSSTTNSSNVAGQFRNESVPLIVWEQALLQDSRVPMATSGEVLSSQTTIQITDNSHPITEGLPLGSLQVFGSGGNMSVARGGIASNVDVLATPADGTGGAIMTADAGETLNGGHVAPANRVFLFFEDASWLNANTTGEALLERSVCWAMGMAPPSVVTQPQDVTVQAGDTIDLFVDVSGASPFAYSWRRNGQLIPNSNVANLTIANAVVEDSGMYVVEVSNACGDVTSAMALVTVNDIPCDADFDDSGVVDITDLLGYLSLWFQADPGAEFTGDDPAVIDISDLLAFLAAWFAGCP